MGLNRLFRRITGNNKVMMVGGSTSEIDRCGVGASLGSLGYPSCPALYATDPTGNNSSGTTRIGCCAATSSSSVSHAEPVLALDNNNKENCSGGRKYPTKMKKCSTSSVNLKGCQDQTQMTAPHTNRKKFSWLPTSSSFVLSTGGALYKSASSKSLTTSNNQGDGNCNGTLPRLPEPLMLRCLDAVDDPFELYRLRALNGVTYRHIAARLERVVEMDVRKVKFDELVTAADAAVRGVATSPNAVRIAGGECWYAHPSGAHKVMARFAGGGCRIEILVDDCWTSRDVVLLCNIMDAFRYTLRDIKLDAPVFELIIASLSIIDLDLWYAYQCFMKAVNDYQLHFDITPQNMRSGEELYWPNAESLVIRTSEKDSTHLSRIIDYGVRSKLVMDRRRLNTLKIILTDVDKLNRTLSRNLYHFRCWAGSAGFDDRFSQHYCVV